MVRIANINDANQIYSLEEASFKKGYSLQTIIDDLNNDKITTFVYEKNNQIIGYISLYCLFEEANIQKIVVIEKERRKGVATELINYSINWLKNKDISSIYLEVNENNSVALSVYYKVGFEKVGTRKNYYGLDSAIILQKQI